MIGGLIKSSSRIALVAVAGVAFGGVAAQAADLGGDCCADLEERVAELEATTARKGNRKVSLTVSGQVNSAVVFWDADVAGSQEEESNAYVGTNNASRSRFRFKGKAQINADWSAGFLMEIGVRANDLQDLDQNTTRDDAGLDIRHEALYIKSKSLGTIWLGQTSDSLDGITEICLGCGMGNGPDYDNYFTSIAYSGDDFHEFGGSAAATAGEGTRQPIVRYISPTFAGFSFSASTGGDDYWDAALRYAGEFGRIRLAGGVGYGMDTNGVDSSSACDGTTTNGTDSDRDCTLLGASASIMDVPTGLYLSGAYGEVNDENEDTTDTSWFVTAGIKQKWLPVGKTNIWGSYGQHEREINMGGIGSLANANDSELVVIGAGIEQKIDAAAMDLYLNYYNIEIEATSDADKIDSGADVVILGARIKF